ncbi:quinone oxidoreductase [Sandarakinorhabdus cyanobacteriorum]|uniref:Quinone oxidoreductase n=1 Tax=Sandarakinorhabdus cyanobacteriorum TaxID=1981098 RepID=A0A255YLS0_9SPHN|nr:quinone oxidoreductase [Sandarakinorhabdus cyanobacteriorum]OYQ30141.1 quinone oxidoreductase [Sandarakinorhabdus cyanobacteriorum]
MKAISAIIRQTGGPEVITWEEAMLPPPGPGAVMVQHRSIGINFIDTYYRRGIYPMPLPGGLGLEAAGVVVAVGPGVTQWREGDRVVSFCPERGAYASHRNIAAASLFALPDAIDDDTAAAGFLKAATAEFLVERCARVEAGWPVLVHAAAGGVGLILVQWLKSVGALVIGTVSSAAKAEAARGAGCDHVINYAETEVAPAVRALTNGAGVRVTYDGVGRSTWAASLDATGRRGLIVNYGNADAAVGPVELAVLAQKASLVNTRPTLFDYYTTPEERAAGAARVWEMIASRQIAISIGQRWPLAEAAAAHVALEGRATTGSSLLIP